MSGRLTPIGGWSRRTPSKAKRCGGEYRKASFGAGSIPGPRRRQPSLSPQSFSAIDGWIADDHCAAFECYLRSAGLTGQPLPGPDEISFLLEDREGARAFFEENFAAYRVLGAAGALNRLFRAGS